MSRKRTGTIQKVTGPDGKVGYKARVTLDSGERIWVQVPAGYSEARAREFAAARSEQAVGEVLAKPVVVAAAVRGETCDAWFERFSEDRRTRGQTAVRTDVARWSVWISPRIGSKPMIAVTKADVEDIRDALDSAIERYNASGRAAGNLAPGSAANVWGTLVGAFGFAGNAKRRELRILDGRPNPCDGVLPPERGARRSKVYPYPSELLALLACDEVPQAWKETHVLAGYLYVRPGELRALQLTDIDFEGGRVIISKAWDTDGGKLKPTKTLDPRSVPIEPALLPLLRILHTRGRGVGPLAPLMGEIDVDRMALVFRRQLRAAGVTRHELFADSVTELPVRFRSWRDAGITWRAIRGDEPLRIKQGAGHRSFQTTEGYIREAMNVSVPPASVFPQLPAAFLQAAQSSSESSWMMPVILHSSDIANDSEARRCGPPTTGYDASSVIQPRSWADDSRANADDGPQARDSASEDYCADESSRSPDDDFCEAPDGDHERAP